MHIKKSNLPRRCGANLTSALQEERSLVLLELSRKNQSLSLLFEASGNPGLSKVALQLEMMQLNEIVGPRARLLIATGTDLKTRIVNETVREIQEYYELSDYEAQLLKEGFWDAVQSGIGNFAGGVDKVLKTVKLKKEPKGWEQAQKIFQKVAEKEGNAMMKDLAGAIGKETTDLESGLGSGKNDQTFPVNKNSSIFQSGVNTIASTYDTIVAGTEKEPDAEGYLPVEVANELIEQLRIMVQKYIADTEREKGGMYVSFGGGGKAVAEEGIWHNGTLILEAEEGEEELDPDAEYEKIMRGQDSPVFKRMSSMKAPLVIAGVGALLGATGWMASQPWFHKLVIKILDLDTGGTDTAEKIVSTVEDDPVFSNLGDVKSGEGMTQFFSHTDAGAGLDLGPGGSTDDLLKVAKNIGGGDIDQGFKNMASMTQGTGNPTAAYEALKGLKSGGESMQIGEFFKNATEMSGVGGTIFAIPPGPVIAKSIGKKVVKTVVKETIKTGAGGSAAAAVAMMTGAAPILAGIGLSTVVAGAALAAIRHRAKKKSRMGVLQDLLSQLNLLEPKSVDLPPQEDVDVTVVLTNPEEGEVVEGRRYSLKDVYFPRVQEATVVAMAGLEGDPDLETTGGKLSFMLPSVSLQDPVPKVTDVGEIPDVVKGIAAKLPDLDLDAEDVNVTVDDRRKEEKIPVKPPVPVIPGNIAKGEHAVCVFTTKDGAEIWRILKKVTYKKYAQDAKRSGDKDAPKFASRYNDYDDILNDLRGDGVIVDTPELEKELTKISSGPQGDQYKISYTRTRKNKKTGKETRKKSITGGYTVAGEVKSIGDIRKNIKGAGNRRPRGVDKFTVIYLVGQDVVAGLKAAGMDDNAAKNTIMVALSKWSQEEKIPKMKDIGVTDEAAADVLRAASLAEARNYQYQKNYRFAVIDIDNFFTILDENISRNDINRWHQLAGI